ncbi:conserved hypothetical protein [Microbacterium sp. 8M]|uniref:hypothetical protein n=1 Tax=Microbacterium sp. 8M TaxID=2653153 RepID=UPI0012F16548|nr:hypothetical protein [Microbacterium sp. 8M]VXB42291.1 conserved hypothetical protein [Microbacterium sp. 8M]
MKLSPTARVDLGQGALAFPHPPTVCLRADGSALCIATLRTDAGWETSLIQVQTSGEQRRLALPEGAFGAQPVIIDRGAAGVAVLVDDRTLVVADEALSSATTVTIPDLFAATDRERRLTAGGIARRASDDTWLVVLTDPSTFQNARTIAALRVDDATAAWQSAELLPGDDYPMAGGRTSTAPGGVAAPTIADAIEVAGVRFVAAQGSDTASMLKYGSDFFTLAELDAAGRVARRVFEASGWKKQPGKHGIRARFTSDGVSAILTPVFRTGEWAGRQRLVRLSDGALEEIPPIRGAAGFAVADVRAGQVVLASDDALLFAETAG